MSELLADSAVQLQTTMPVLHSLALQQHLRLTGLLTEKTNQTAVLNSPRDPATAPNSASESSGPVESDASAAQAGPGTDGHASAAQPGCAAASSLSASQSVVCGAVRWQKRETSEIAFI